MMELSDVARDAAMRAGARFRDLHTTPVGFIMPNAWDAGSAVLLADAGFPAIATTSAGIAFSLARPDNDARWAGMALTRAEMMNRVRQIAAAVTVPVNGDLQDGYGDSPGDVAETIRLAIAGGLAGANIEDKHPRTNAVYDEELVVERIAAARTAIEAAGMPFVLTARADAFLVSRDAAEATHIAIRRLNRFRLAGADCLYPPGVADLATVKTLIAEIDGPLNIVTGLGAARLDPRDLIAAGVQRVSLGGAIARAALGFVRDSLRELRDDGTIRFAETQIPQGELNVLFARARGGEPAPL
jgi:2-methylisocitrate lyase-like PEP mutase family enzyme